MGGIRPYEPFEGKVTSSNERDGQHSMSNPNAAYNKQRVARASESSAHDSPEVRRGQTEEEPLKISYERSQARADWRVQQRPGDAFYKRQTGRLQEQEPSANTADATQEGLEDSRRRTEDVPLKDSVQTSQAHPDWRIRERPGDDFYKKQRDRLRARQLQGCGTLDSGAHKSAHREVEPVPHGEGQESSLQSQLENKEPVLDGEGLSGNYSAAGYEPDLDDQDDQGQRSDQPVADDEPAGDGHPVDFFQPRLEDEEVVMGEEVPYGEYEAEGQESGGMVVNDHDLDQSDFEMEEEEDSLPIVREDDTAALNKGQGKGKGRMPYDWEISAAFQGAIDAMNAERRREAQGAAGVGNAAAPGQAPGVNDHADPPRPIAGPINPIALQVTPPVAASLDEDVHGLEEGEEDEDEMADVDLDDPEQGTFVRQKKAKDWRKHCNDWRADVRQVLCDLMLEDPEKIWHEDDLVGRVESKVVEVAWSHMNSLEGDLGSLNERTLAILRRSPATFTPAGRSTTYAGQRQNMYRLNCGPGRLVGKDALQAFVERPNADVELIDSMSMWFSFFVSITRDSGRFLLAENVRKLDGRCKAQMDAYWNTCGDCTTKPSKVHTFDEVTPPLPTWTSYVFSGSSTDTFLDRRPGGQNGVEGNRIRELLRRYDDVAGSIDERFNVGLLGSGVDFATSNNDSWKILSQAYPNLNFYIIMVMPTNKIWDASFFTIDREEDIAWACFQVSRLASLYDMAEYPTPADESARDIAHTRFLTANTLIQYMKQDMSIKYEPGLNVSVGEQNMLASTLSAPGRKSFPLPAERVVQCEVCKQEANGEINPTLDWMRGTTSSVALRCADCQDHDIDDVNVVARPLVSSLVPLGPWLPEPLDSDRLFACPFQCKTNKTFANVTSLKEHKCEHEQTTEFPCSVGGCRVSFDSQIQLNTHLIGAHPHRDREGEGEGRSFVCKVIGCGARFSTADSRKTHVSRMHRSSFEIKCPEEGCRGTFETEAGLSIHRTRVHGGIGKFQCEVPECSRSFPSGVTLASHMHDDHGDTSFKFKCPVEDCDRAFGTYTGLTIHVRCSHPGQEETTDTRRSHPKSKETTEEVIEGADDRQPETIREFKCPAEGCVRSLDTSGGLATHTRYKHPELKKKK